MQYSVKVKGSAVKVNATSDGWNPHVKEQLLCKLKDTGNGYIAKFPSYSSTYQTNYICLDYDEAHELMFALVEQKRLFENEDIDYLISRLQKLKDDSQG